MTGVTMLFLILMAFTIWIYGFFVSAEKSGFAALAYLIGSFVVGAIVGVFV